MIKKLQAKFYILNIVLLITSYNIRAQDMTLDWVNQMGGSGNENGKSIDQDDNGNLYTVGSFSGIADFDSSTNTSNLTSNGGTDVFITKTNSSGGFIWAKQIGNNFNDSSVSIKIDVLENIIIAGNFHGIVDFDPGTGVYNLDSGIANGFFILKLDSDGQFIWAKQLSGDSNSGVASLNTDSSGNIYTTGHFFGTLDFNPNSGVNELTATPGALDVFISKLSFDGDYIWAKAFKGTSDNYGTDLATDAQDNVIITGFFSHVLDVDPSNAVVNLNTSGNSDAFIVKLNTNGNYVWAKHIGGSDYDYGRSITTDSNGNSYIIGDFESTIDLNPDSGVLNVTSVGASDMFVAKFDNSGNFINGIQIGGNANEFCFDATIDTSNNLYITGRFEDTTTFDFTNTTNLISYGNSDSFVAKFNPALELQFAQNTGSTAFDAGLGLVIDNSNNIYTTGAFRGTSNFAISPSIHNLTSFGQTDIFLQKLTFCALDNTVAQTSNTLSSNSTIGTYQWIDCNNGNTAITGETNQSFTPTSNGNYAVRITNNNCVILSDCIEVSSLGVNHFSTNAITFHPNPAQDNLWFNTKANASIEITIIDSLGRIIIKKQFKNHNGTIEFPLTNLNNGMYFVKMTQENNETIKKLMIKN